MGAYFCRTAGNRTRATRTPCAHTTIMLRSVVWLLYLIVLAVGVVLCFLDMGYFVFCTDMWYKNTHIVIHVYRIAGVYYI